MLADFRQFVPVLAAKNVQFILIGGLAATVHGVARATYDLDIVYARNPDNIQRLAAALQPYSPYLRGAPPGLPFCLDAETVQHGLNFTLTTTLGNIDILGEVTGGGTYEDLLTESKEVIAFGVPCRCVTLSKLIQLKRAAGRPKDLEAIAELEALQEEQEPE